MSEVVISVENLSKQYRLGVIGTGTISHDLNRWWHKVRGKEDPYLQIGEANDRSVASESPYVWALKDVNFEVKRGEVLGIIGRNGAGKSTLLKLLSRVTSPTTGSIKAKGRIASLLEVGTGFHPELTGRENIFLNGAILGMSRAEIKSKLDEIIEFSGTARYIDTPVKRYSSGMTVRLAFAVAAHLEPEILIVDEVLAVGDAEFQKKAIGKMQDVAKGGERTVLFVSHNMGTIKSLCTRGLILNKGTSVFEGNIEDTVGQYLNLGHIYSADLRGIENRKGSGLFKFTNIRLISNNKEVDAVFSGENLNIELQYEIIDPLIKLNDLIIGISFLNDLDEPIYSFVSDEVQVVRNNSKLKDCCLTLKIPRLMLRGGLYKIRLFSALLGTSSDNHCDVIDNAFQLSVMSTDYYNKGKVIRSHQSAFIEAQFVL